MNRKTWQIVTNSSSETERFANQIGQNLRGSEVIELISDLGGGKTTFVRGLASGIQSQDHVSSPTFKITNEYRGKRLAIKHFDFYRLHEAGLIANELHEAMQDKDVVVVIEWADIVQKVLPEERLTLTLQPLSDTKRHIKILYPPRLAYLLEGLTS